MHFLTIAIPTYNREVAVSANVARLIGILSEVNDKDISVLVIDNDSTDGTYLRLTSLSCKYDGHVRVLRNEKNLGYNGNFVRLFEEAKCEYLLFLSDEDFLISDYLNDLVEFLRHARPLFTSSPFYLNDNVKPYRGRSSRKRVKLQEFSSASFYLSGLVFNVEHSINIIKKSKEHFTHTNQIYPQVLLASILLAKGDCYWFEKPLAQKQFNLDTSITYKGGRYDLLDGRWIQHILQLEFFYFWRSQMESNHVIDKVSKMIRYHNRNLFGKLYSSIEREYPEVYFNFLIGACIVVHKALFKIMLKRLICRKFFG